MAAIAHVRIPDSPSQLADSLANIRLDDINNVGDDSMKLQNEASTTFIVHDEVDNHANNSSINEANPGIVAENLKKISSGIEAIREQFFVIQEKRHAGIFIAVNEEVGSSSFDQSTSTPTKENKSQKEKSLVLDVEMAKLNGLMEDISNRFETAEKQVQQLDNSDSQAPTLQRRGSLASLNSLSSLDSFDDAFGVETVGLSKKPDVVRKQYAELLHHWDSIQKEAKMLEEELGGDKYLRVFSSICDQMEEMMDSLDKALANCHDFVFAFNRDKNMNQQIERESENAFSHSPKNDQSTWRTNEERLAALQTVKRSFNVKRTSYGPACEQMFSSLERGVKQHSTKNGTILRRFMELKTRWRSLRERVSKMDKELKRIETQLMEFDANASQEIESLAVATPPRRPLSRLNPSTQSPAAPTNRFQSIHHDRSPSIEWSPSTSSNQVVGDLSMSLTYNRSPSARMMPRPSSSASQRTDDTNISQSRIPRLMSAGKRIIGGVTSRRTSNIGEERPSSALSFTSNSSALFGKSPNPTKFSTGPDSSPPVSFSRRRENETNLRNNMQTPEPTIMARVQRMSLFGGGSGTSSNMNRRSSRPPPVRYSANRVSAAAENQISKSPSSSSLSAIAARKSPQQTVKPLNISKRQSSLFIHNNHNGRTTPLSAAALAKIPYAAANVNGESNLAGEYHIMSSPSSSNVGGGTTYSTGDGASSVSNYRTKRSSMISSQFVSQIPKPSSITSGRETPTFSDGGNSSVWEGTIYGGRPSSRLTAGYGNRFGGTGKRGFDAYKPNPNDAIDVEVARVVNSIGIRIERVDPPLPRGVKELNPSSTTLVRYQVGTKVIVCKLLQLHRPNSTSINSSHGPNQSSLDKAKKVLTRVGGGWIDLEQYLLSRLGTM